MPQCLSSRVTPAASRWHTSRTLTILNDVHPAPAPTPALFPLPPQDHSLGAPVSVLTGHTRSITLVHFSPVTPHVLLSASYDGTVRLWNAGEGGGVAAVLGIQPELGLFGCREGEGGGGLGGVTGAVTGWQEGERGGGG